MPQCSSMACRSLPPMQARVYFIVLLFFACQVCSSDATLESAPSLRSDRDDASELDIASFSLPSSRSVDAQHAKGDAPARSLQQAPVEVEVVTDWQFPSDTTIQFQRNQVTQHTDTTYDAGEDKKEVMVISTLAYKQVLLRSPSVAWGTPHSIPKIKLVASLATRDKCYSDTRPNQRNPLDIPMDKMTKTVNNIMGYDGESDMGFVKGPLQLVNSGTSLSADTSTTVYPLGRLQFMWGGIYKICYTPDGTFGDFADTDASAFKDNVLPISVKVIGVWSPCSDGDADGCTHQERWECSFSRKGLDPSHCVFDLRPDGGRQGWGVVPSYKSKMTWTQEITGAQPVTPQCGVAGPDENNFDLTDSGIWLTLDGVNDPVSMPQIKDTQTLPFTVAACYCPNYNYETGGICGNVTHEWDTNPCCNDMQEFFQPFGIIYYWSTSICDYDSVSCHQPYLRVLPQQKFVLRVNCPPSGGCYSSDSNRIKFMDYILDNDRGTWDQFHGCKTVLGEATSAIWPDNVVAKTLSGGTQTDFKEWRSQQVKFRLSLYKSLDVCYCHENCEDSYNGANWFRIGVVHTSEAFAIASKTSAVADPTPIDTIRDVNKPGSFTLYGGIESNGDAVPKPDDSNKYSGKALLNIISFDRDAIYGPVSNRVTFEKYKGYDQNIPQGFQQAMDIECSRQSYDNTLMVGGWSKSISKSYMAQVDAGNENTVSEYFPFVGSIGNKTITLVRAGIVAMCYCAMLDDNDECTYANDWIYVGRLTIRGPVGGQTWILPTHIEGAIEVHGWGFEPNVIEEQYIRIIPSSDSCTGNANDPDGSTGFKVDCPLGKVNGAPCAVAEAKTNIDLEVLTSEVAGVHIVGIEIHQTRSILTFTGRIVDYLQDGDVITIDLVANNGELLCRECTIHEVLLSDRGAQNSLEKFDTYTLMGVTPHPDAAGKYYTIGHKVSTVHDLSGAVLPNQMSIPIGWRLADRPSFSFYNNLGSWIRHNKAETSNTLKIKSGTQQELKVCWGYKELGFKRYYAEAGTVKFEDPPSMLSASVSLSTRQDTAIAPTVITLKTDPDTTAYTTSKSSPTELKLRFLDTSSTDGVFIPAFSDDIVPNDATSQASAVIPTLDQIVPEGKSQWVCGRLFSELWSDDQDGFPMPLGCYFSRKYRDDGPNEKFYRDFTIAFPPGGGLKQGKTYQVVFNAQIGHTSRSIGMGENLVDAYAMCVGATGCQRPYEVLEKGTAKADTSSTPKVACGAQCASSSFHNEIGFQLLHGSPTNNILDLQTNNKIEAILRGMDSSGVIKRNNYLRMILWPITVWQLGGSCSATCQPDHNVTDAVCGDVTCEYEEVIVGSGRKSIVKMQLPQGMTDISSSVKHTVAVSNLQLPTAGFFATRMGAQISMPDDTRPSYTASWGALLVKSANPGQTTGRIVVTGDSGYGPKPFQGDMGNILYLRITFGATLYNNGQLNASSLTITLPPGYSCSVPGTGELDLSLDVFTLDLNSDGYYDNSRGTLSTLTADGSWIMSAGRLCVYGTQKYNRIYQGMTAYIRVSADNPEMPVSKSDPENKWSIGLMSKGVNTRALYGYTMPTENFITLQQEETYGREYWAGNVAVLGVLHDRLVQPTDLRYSEDPTNPIIQEAYIWVKPTQFVGRKGYIIVDAPEGYDFGESCQVTDLPLRYYAYRGEAQEQVYNLQNRGNCTGFRFPNYSATFNRAQIHIRDTVFKDKLYGFSLRVQHPSVFLLTQTEEWYLWTRDSNGFGLDGSVTTTLWNRRQDEFGNSSLVKFYHQSYAMYKGLVTLDVGVEVKDLRPSSLTGKNSEVNVVPFVFPYFTDTSLRITAPYGFKWSTANGFKKYLNMTTRIWPADPTIANDNQIFFDRVSFANDEVYGFGLEIEVPDFVPTTSMNNFFVEFGYKKENIQERTMASLLPGAPIRAISNCRMDYQSNYVGYDSNRIEIMFEIMSPAPEKAGVIIKGREATEGFTFVCDPRMLPGSQPFPADIKCISYTGTDNRPQITFRVQQEIMQPGLYMFDLTAVNPNRIQGVSMFLFGSWYEASQWPGTDIPLDASMLGASFPINGPMLDGRMVFVTEAQKKITGRNDRPGMPNTLIFRFQLRSTPTKEHDLKLRAPRGFEFVENCLPGLIVDKNQVFGPDTEIQWPIDYATWEESFAPTNCVGSGRDAMITIPVGLQAVDIYVFRINIHKNPIATPDWNYWSLDFNGESCYPTPSFNVWTFTDLSVTPVSRAKTQPSFAVAVPLNLGFKPFNTIPMKCITCQFGGVIRLTAPSGFTYISNDQGVCEVKLYETNIGEETSAYAPSQLKCTVVGSQLFLEIIGGRDVMGGTTYTLIVSILNPNAIGAAQSWLMDTFGYEPSDPANPTARRLNTDPTCMQGRDPVCIVDSLFLMDQIVIPGYEVFDVLQEFTVANPMHEYKGRVKVSTVTIKLVFDQHLVDDDQIHVFPPPAFDISGNPNLQECAEFRWLTAFSPLPSSGVPTCTYIQGQSELIFTVQEYKDVALDAGIPIHFAVATHNPVKTPEGTTNFWKARHMRKVQLDDTFVELATNVAPGWTILPQLEDVQIILHGAMMAAETVSDLKISFKAIRTAETLVINAKSPAGFHFGNTLVQHPYLKDDRSEREIIIINNLGMRPDQVTEFMLWRVQLGEVGGQTTFSLTTYKDSTMEEQRDEKLDYTGGFRLPGILAVTSKDMQSRYAVDAPLYPVESLFPSQMGVLAHVVFTIVLSRSVGAMQDLKIECMGDHPYELRQTSFAIVGKERIDTEVVQDPINTAKLHVTLKPGKLSSEVALVAGITYEIRMWVIPDRGTTHWSFLTTDFTDYPTNTNDGTTIGFTPVEKIFVSVNPHRRAPLSIVDVNIDLSILEDAGDLQAHSVKIIAPPNFVFPATGCGNMCHMDEPLGTTMRRTAIIKSPTGVALTQLPDELAHIKIHIQTPEYIGGAAHSNSPISESWYVAIMDEAGGVTGWGDGVGFRIDQMPAQVSYAGVRDLRKAEIMFNFTMKVSSGTYLYIEHPTGFRLRCTAYGTLKQGSLPGKLPSCTDEPMILHLTETLVKDREYSFSVEGDVPSMPASPNTFSLTVRDRDMNVVDAAYLLGGGIAYHDFGFRTPQLSWSGSEPDEKSTITISIDLTAVMTGPQVKALLFSFPHGFEQAATRPSDITNSNPHFPLAQNETGGWARFNTYKDKLKIFTNDSYVDLKPGSYSWTFPVKMPYSTLPHVNVWYLTLCNNRSCEHPYDNHSMVAFPIQGFEFGEISVQTLRHMTSGASLGLNSWIWTCSYVVPMLFTLLASTFYNSMTR